MSDVGAMVAELIAAGCDPIVAAKVVAESFVAGAASGGHRVDQHDPVMERRRAWDRDRKRLQRGLRPSASEWVILVSKILERDGHKCSYCGSTENLTADHVVPLTRGGTNEESNLTACCIPCNTKKSNRLVSEWLPANAPKFHVDVHPIPPDPENASLLLKSKLEERKKEREQKRGTRLPPDFPTADDLEFAAALSWSDKQIEAEAQNFRDYWLGVPGSKGVKLDWPATWRRWVRSSRVKPVATLTTTIASTDTNWRPIIESYLRFKHWPKGHGNEPGMASCRAPPELLREFGLLREAG